MRILLFLITNFAITTGLGIIAYIVLNFLGIDTEGMGGLLAYSLVIGFGGSIFSLLMSKSMAKRSVGAVVIVQPQNEMERWLVQTIEAQSQKLGIKMPEVAIYESDDMNAFATGAFKNSALVAVSTGLMEQMTRDEVEAVLAHEMSHVNNGDMVTMSLLQGLVNTFVIFIARLISGLLAKNRGARTLIYMGLQMGLMFLANMIIMWFSRRREYYADAGSADLVGPTKMIAALKKLQQPHQQEEMPEGLAAFGISGAQDSLFSTHPSLDNRIQALQEGAYKI